MSNLGATDIMLIVFFAVAAIFGGLYMLNRWAGKKYADQEEMIQKSKQNATIYVIDKKKVKAHDANLPKAVLENLPRLYKFIKMPLVKAKVGPQIVTLMCDKKVFEALPVKKSVKVVMAGIYIVEVKSGKPDKASTPAKKQKPWDKLLAKFKG